MKLLHFLSFLSFSLFTLVSAAPAAEFSVTKRDVSGAELLGLVQELTTGINGLTAHTKQSKWSRTGASDDFKSAISNVKSSAENFSSSCAYYDIQADPIAGLVVAIIGLVIAIVDLVVSVYLWILVLGLDVVQGVATIIFELIFIILYALIPFGQAGPFGALAFHLNSGITVAENISHGFGIKV